MGERAEEAMERLARVGRTAELPKREVVTVIRHVPMRCQVCEGRKCIPDMPDDLDGGWVTCPACKGQGWLQVTETETRTTNG